MKNAARRTFWVLLGMIALSAGLTWLTVRGQQENLGAISERLRLLERYQGMINEDVELARLGLEPHYDQLTDRIRAMDRNLARLHRDIALLDLPKGQELNKALLDYTGAFERKKQNIEDFKSINAIFRNSLMFIPHANKILLEALKVGNEGGERLVLDSATALSEILFMVSSNVVSDEAANSGSLRRLKAALSTLPQPAATHLRNFLRHNEILHRSYRRTSQILESILNAETNAQTRILAAAFAAHRNSEKTQLVFERRALITGVVFFLGIVMLLLWRQSKHQETLESNVTARTAELQIAKKEAEGAAAAAEAADRTKSQFLATMSHEIRTPMNGVMGMASVLLSSDLSPEQRNQTEIIRDSGEALLSLLNDILDVSKIEAGQVELEILDVDLQRLLESVTALWRSRMQEKGLTFSIKLAPDVAPVLKTDPTRIRQILFNLISNAIKFTKEGGVTLVISQRAPTDDELELRFAVSDTGIGVAPDAQSRLFTKFFQADSSTTRKYGGTGLGLAICKQLSELLGGEIGFDSKPGSGSTFWFTIRCAPGNAGTVDNEAWTEKTKISEAPTSDRPLRILAAEDNRLNQAVLRGIFDKTDHSVDMVGDGNEAVSAVMRVPYDLVLMDIQMPEMDGMTATRKIRGLRGEIADIPIIALTANAMKGDREKYLDAGMSDYLSKPIRPKQLKSMLAKWAAKIEPSDRHPDDAGNKPGTLATLDQATADISPILDEAMLGELSDAVGPDVLHDLVAGGIADMRDRITRLTELREQSDFDAIQGQAHSIKGAGGGLGATRLYEIANELDISCRENRTDDALRLLDEIGPVAQEAFDTLGARFDLHRNVTDASSELAAAESG